MKPTHVTTNVIACARCGCDHDALEFSLLDRPLTLEQLGPEAVWDYWAPCPTNAQPIMLRWAP